MLKGWLECELELLEPRSEVKQTNDVSKAVKEELEKFMKGEASVENVIQVIKDSMISLVGLLTGHIDPEPDLEFCEFETEEDLDEWRGNIKEEFLKEDVINQLGQLYRILQALERFTG